MFISYYAMNILIQHYRQRGNIFRRGGLYAAPTSGYLTEIYEMGDIIMIL